MNSEDLTIPKAALVTGGARRIGRAICDRLAADGWNVAVHYRDSEDAADHVCAEIDAAGGGKAIPLCADLSDIAEARGLVARAVEAVGPLGLLVNNASIFEGPEWRDMTDDEIERHMTVNYHAPLAMMQEFGKALPDGSSGAVVNVIDQRVWNPSEYFIAYTASKSALWTVTRTMALALAPHIRVNAVGPGPTLPSPRQTEEQFEDQWRAVPLARPTRPAEIADAVAYLAGARAVTGQMIALDGGEHLGWRQGGGTTAPSE